MRMQLVVAALGAAVSVLAAGTGAGRAQMAASQYPVCAQFLTLDGGGLSCYYRSLEECRVSMSGVGGICSSNPWYTGPPAATAGKPKRRDR